MMKRLFFFIVLFLLTAAGWGQTWAPNGTVHTIIPDGAGGIYIGGEFTAVGGQSRVRIARINADGSLHPFFATVDGTIRSMSISGGKLYIGGDFKNVNWVSRKHIASFDLATGTLTDWEPAVEYPGGIGDNLVYSILATADRLYVGGQFNQVNGQSRMNLVSFDITGVTPTLTDWTPDPNLGGAINGTVFSLVEAEGKLYVGGAFNQIAGQSRLRLVSFDVTTGTPALTDWSLQDLGYIQTLWASDGILYASGEFSLINGQTRNRLASFDITGSTPTLTTWTAHANSRVLSFTKVGSRIYMGGIFTQIAGQNRQRLASFDISTGTPVLTDWNPNANYIIYSLATVGDRLFGGGGFGVVAGQPKPYLFGFDYDVLPVSFGNIQAELDGNALLVQWTTLKEENNGYFEIEASADGKDFTKVGAVVSKAKEGNSDTALEYSFTLSLSSTLLSGLTALMPLLAVFAWGMGKRRRMALPVSLLTVAYTWLITGCEKQSLEVSASSPRIYVRIAQVDKDGTKSYSKVVVAQYKQ
ncbi:MAG: delta-60 repeat domain-containing protein [Niabella sp.]